MLDDNFMDASVLRKSDKSFLKFLSMLTSLFLIMQAWAIVPVCPGAVLVVETVGLLASLLQTMVESASPGVVMVNLLVFVAQY